MNGWNIFDLSKNKSEIQVLTSLMKGGVNGSGVGRGDIML